jgi:hypothetical protein
MNFHFSHKSNPVGKWGRYACLATHPAGSRKCGSAAMQRLHLPLRSRALTNFPRLAHARLD